MQSVTRILFTIIVSITLAGSALAQRQECLAEAIPINTGANGNVALPIGAGDPNWTVIGDPDPATTEPRPATTIVPYPGAWQPALPGSTWISSYPTSVNPTNGKYTYQYCFCLNPNFDVPKLTLSLRADDSAEVFLNGVSIGQTPNPSHNTASPTTLTANKQSDFKPGRNCLTVDVQNTGSVASGLNLVGQISAAGLAVQRPECCNPTGDIQGRKWNDANGNGVQDTGEAGLAGWTITLSNGQTAVTDANGFYSFVDVPPGSYTLSETQQSGWQQTFPTGGQHQINLAAGQAIVGRDFGNRRGETPTDGPCSLCGKINSACCLGKNAQGQLIYSFLAQIDYQSFSNPPASCQLTVSAPPSVTILSYGPAVLTAGTTTFVSGTVAISGTPPSPFCIKVKCAGGKESCESAVCMRLLPPCP